MVLKGVVVTDKEGVQEGHRNEEEESDQEDSP